jgi:hypothetical protein
MRAGVNLMEVGDLRTYLDSKMMQSKTTKNTPHTVEMGSSSKKSG